MIILFLIIGTDIEAPWHWALSDKTTSGEAITPEDKAVLGAVDCTYIHVIVPGISVVIKLYTVEDLSDKYKRQAIGFNIEDELAQPISSVHIGLDSQAARVAIVSDAYMENLLAMLETFGVSARVITADYDSVLPQRFCFDGRFIENANTGLGFAIETVHAGRFIGANQSLPAHITAQEFLKKVILAHNNEHVAINLRSGNHAQKFVGGLKRFKRSAFLAASCAAVFLLYNFGSGYYYHNKTQAIETEIQHVFSRIFPEQKPPFRPVQKTLEARRNVVHNDNGIVFIRLSAILTKSVENVKSVEINSLRYNQNKAELSVSIFYKNFNDVESLKQNIARNGGVFLEEGTRQNGDGITGNAIIRLGS